MRKRSDLGSLAAGAVGIAPSIMGYTGTQEQSFSAASSAIQGTVVTGASSVGQIMGTLQEVYSKIPACNGILSLFFLE